MKKTKKLALTKITISKLSEKQSSLIYGGTIGNNGCGPKSKDNGEPCKKSDDCTKTFFGPGCQ